jgi:membrane-associated phospholipid phosphatase
VHRERLKYAVAIALCLSLATASADPDPTPPPAKPAPVETKGPWYRGPYARNRIINLSVTGALGLYLLSGVVFDTSLTARTCRWCDPPDFDRAARHALLWQNTGLADSLSSYDAYVLAPAVGLTLLILSDGDASASRLIDDVLPVAETVAIVQVATQFGKYAFARQRPYAHYGTVTIDPNADNNSSFWSGHSVLGFAITSAAGTVCHFRGYWTEPYVWGAGIALSLSTEYLRVAADKHYLSDVVGGGLIGLGVGLLVPRLMQRSVKIVPVQNGVGVTGHF